MAVPLTQLSLARTVADRRADLRNRPEIIAALRDSEFAHALGVANGQLQLEGLALREFPLPSGIPMAFLGTAEIAGVEHHYFSPLQPWPETSEDWFTLRAVGTELDDLSAGLAVAAVALQNWHLTHSHCSRCGNPTLPRQAGWVRQCPLDQSEHFPRTDPAVIMSVVDAEDRLLLARQNTWAPHHFSVLAGFCEPGESAETAVAREVQEEAGLKVTDLQYLGSQPWPFPASLMLAFHATAVGQLQIDGDEIGEARWYSRNELAAACELGEVQLPGRISIAHRIIQRWYGSELPLNWLRV